MCATDFRQIRFKLRPVRHVRHAPRVRRTRLRKKQEEDKADRREVVKSGLTGPERRHQRLSLRSFLMHSQPSAEAGGREERQGGGVAGGGLEAEGS